MTGGPNTHTHAHNTHGTGHSSLHHQEWEELAVAAMETVLTGMIQVSSRKVELSTCSSKSSSVTSKSIAIRTSMCGDGEEEEEEGEEEEEEEEEERKERNDGWDWKKK